MKKADPTYFFTAGGHVQLWMQGDYSGILLTKDRRTATKVAAWFKKTNGRRISVAEAGTVQGETLAVQLNASLHEGANCAFIVESVEKNGRPAVLRMMLPR